MPERSDQEVLNDYRDSLSAMNFLGRVSAQVDVEMKRIHGELLGEILARELLPEAAMIYAENERLPDMIPVAVTKWSGPLAGPALLLD